MPSARPVSACRLGTAVGAGPLAGLDGAAEKLLQEAEKLTRGLETAGLVTTLHVITSPAASAC